MADPLAGAEASIDAQKMDALNALAQFGRRGLEEAALSKQRATQRGSDLATANTDNVLDVGWGGHTNGLNDRQRAELAGIGAEGSAAYVADAAGAMDFLKGEQGAASKVNANYYGQARQAVPGMRSNAAQIADQYRAAYEQRQADIAARAAQDAEARQQALFQIQMLEDQRRRDELLYKMSTPTVERLGFRIPRTTESSVGENVRTRGGRTVR